MGRKKEKGTPEYYEKLTKQAERLKIILDEQKWTHQKLADKIMVDQRNVSRYLSTKPSGVLLSDEKAQEIIELFPVEGEDKYHYKYRKEWLLGIDDFKTWEEEFDHDWMQRIINTSLSTAAIFDFIKNEGYTPSLKCPNIGGKSSFILQNSDGEKLELTENDLKPIEEAFRFLVIGFLKDWSEKQHGKHSSEDE